MLCNDLPLLRVSAVRNNATNSIFAFLISPPLTTILFVHSVMELYSFILFIVICLEKWLKSTHLWTKTEWMLGLIIATSNQRICLTIWLQIASHVILMKHFFHPKYLKINTYKCTFGHIVFLFNTHFDEVGARNRVYTARVEWDFCPLFICKDRKTNITVMNGEENFRSDACIARRTIVRRRCCHSGSQRATGWKASYFD